MGTGGLTPNRNVFTNHALSDDTKPSDNSCEMNANSEHKRREDWLISTMFLAGSVCFTLAFFSQTI